MRKPIQKNSYQGGLYHIYNRGNHKQDVFLERADYIGYLERLREHRKKHEISIICYCLMPNHFHLLVRQDGQSPLYKFIHSLHTSYSMYFNRKYDKVGHLFQNRFKQKEIADDKYLLQLSSYIHLNPIISGLTDKLGEYQWSSYPDYIGLRQGTLCRKEFALLDISPEDYKRITEEEIKERLAIKGMLFEDAPQM